MDIKYYEFDTPIGQMIIFFSIKGIVYLYLLDDSKEDIIGHVNRKYGQTRKVDKNNYDYHMQIIEYLEGKLKKFSLPLDLRGTDFQKKVWIELLKIPYGETISYKEMAINIGTPKGYRAVGGALNKNPVLIVVPCHRVIGSNGNLVGFGGGLKLKERLLALESNNRIIN
ncbi:methylated-DNA--[protein]-cysteine S-methyltransferase [Clostridium sp. Cult1]|uniref:methylated-DNA--[protein]-cysteine S-methyltransferase n=1 Tax=Clostridium sp. Cult1 TaxID=2079002 RepID=UPI001F00C0BF|nr:methylated-DNA--[protein]-cysteine S-methyltransferase [Clostridium sp. Cult1]MCF6462525.1 hypothetical protein [Clostridium sp. Cult1]